MGTESYTVGRYEFLELSKIFRNSTHVLEASSGDSVAALGNERSDGNIDASASVLAYSSHFAVSRAMCATMYSSSYQSGYTYDSLDMIL